MGIPYFYKWLITRYPEIVFPLRNNQCATRFGKYITELYTCARQSLHGLEHHCASGFAQQFRWAPLEDESSWLFSRSVVKDLRGHWPRGQDGQTPKAFVPGTRRMHAARKDVWPEEKETAAWCGQECQLAGTSKEGGEKEGRQKSIKPREKWRESNKNWRGALRDRSLGTW